MTQWERIRLPMQKIWNPSLGQEDPLKEEMMTYSSILAWKIPRTEEPGGLQRVGSMGSQRVRHDWAHTQHIYANLKYLNGRNKAHEDEFGRKNVAQYEKKPRYFLLSLLLGIIENHFNLGGMFQSKSVQTSPFSVQVTVSFHSEILRCRGRRGAGRVEWEMWSKSRREAGGEGEGTQGRRGLHGPSQESAAFEVSASPKAYKEKIWLFCAERFQWDEWKLSVIAVAAAQPLGRVWLLAIPWTTAGQLLCSPRSPGVCSDSCSLSWWCWNSLSGIAAAKSLFALVWFGFASKQTLSRCFIWKVTPESTVKE